MFRKSSSLANAPAESSDHRGFLPMLDSSSGNSQASLHPRHWDICTSVPSLSHPAENHIAEPSESREFLFCLDVWVAMEKDKEAFWEDTYERLIASLFQGEIFGVST